MSSIIVNPEHRAKNTVYLLFSAVLITFLLYLAELLQGGSTGPDFVPSPMMILVAASFISASLLYARIDEEYFHKKLEAAAVQEGAATDRFILLSSYSLRTYVLTPRKVRSPKVDFRTSKETVLEGSDLDGEIWKLRGALWLLLATPLSTTIAVLILEWSVGPSFIIIFLGIAAMTTVYVSARNLFNRITESLVTLAEFHWFDRALTAVRRSEITIERDLTQVRLTIDGLSESIYRAMEGSRKPSQDLDSVPAVITPMKSSQYGSAVSQERPVKLSGEFEKSMSAERLQRRRFTELLFLECDWLRELVRRQNWASLSSRFADLKDSMEQDAIAHLAQAYGRLLWFWRDSMVKGHPTHEFSQFRALLHLMDRHNLLDDVDMIDLIQSVLRYDKSHMANRHWSFSYYRKKIRQDSGYDDQLEGLFYDVTEDVLREDLQTWGPPNSGYPVEQLVQGLEYDHREKTGHQLGVYMDVPKKEIDEAKPMDYSYLDKRIP